MITFTAIVLPDRMTVNTIQLHRHQHANSHVLAKLTCMAFSLCIVACSSISSVSVDFHPQVKTNSTDMRQYEKDRSACEKSTLQQPSKMESNMHANFRKCLIDKGYVLLS